VDLGVDSLEIETEDNPDRAIAAAESAGANGAARR
jgi:hypothetical protein